MPKGQTGSIGARLSRLLAAADETTLDEIDAEIATAEARVKALKASRELVAEEVLNRPKLTKREASKQQQPTQLKAASAGFSPVNGDGSKMTVADKIAAFLVFNGPKRSDSIKNQLGITAEEFDAATADAATFRKDGSVWTLTTAGHQRYSKKD